MGDFENWFKSQDFYTNMRFIHGDRLFDKDGDVYRVLPVQIAYQGWNARQGEIDELKAQLECCRKENAVLLGKVGDGERRISFLEMNIKYVLDHFDMNDLDKAMPRVYEDLKEALRGEHD